MIRTRVVNAAILDRLFVDLAKLAADIERECNELEAEGFEILSIISLNQGHWNTLGYGYSTTQGVVITARG